MNPNKRKIAVAISGASGSIYARWLLDFLNQWNKEHVHTIALVHSTNAQINWELENPGHQMKWEHITTYAKDDFFAPIASGSAAFDTMVVVPCSMGMLGRIANGISDDLISRAADVILKERQKLILVPRETPLNSIHLENMLKLSNNQAIVCPAVPSFYNEPKTIEDLVATVGNRILQLMDIPHDGFVWGDNQDEAKT